MGLNQVAKHNTAPNCFTNLLKQRKCRKTHVRTRRKTRSLV